MKRSILQILRSARGKAQCTATLCPNDNWMELSQTIQKTAASGNIRRMYNGIKTALGPTQAEQPYEVYHSGSDHRPSSSDKLLDGALFRALLQGKRGDIIRPRNIQCLPVRKKPVAVPPVYKLSKAIDSLASEKLLKMTLSPLTSSTAR